MSPAHDHQALTDAITRGVAAAVLPLQQQLATLAEQVAQLRARPAARRLAPADAEALAVLLPAVWAVCGVQVLAVADIVQRARVRPELGAAIERATGLSANEAGVALGRLLRRSLGCNVGELQMHHVGHSRGVALWQLGFTPTTNEGSGGGSDPTDPSLAPTARGRSRTTAAP